MQTVAQMREYINEYVRSQSLETVGEKLIKEYFGIPFDTTDNDDEFRVNGIPMSTEETRAYVKEFFEGLDTTAILELYHKLVV